MLTASCESIFVVFSGGDCSVIVKHRFIDPRLLAPGSIPDLAMRRCVLGQNTLRLFSIGTQQFTSCGILLDGRLANRTEKKVLCVALIRQTYSSWFIRMK